MTKQFIFIRVFAGRLLQESTSAWAWVVDDWYLTTGDRWCHTLSDDLSEPHPLDLLSPTTAPHGLHVSNSHSNVLHLQLDLIAGARVQLYRNPGFEYYRKWVETHALHWTFSPWLTKNLNHQICQDQEMMTSFVNVPIYKTVTFKGQYQMYTVKSRRKWVKMVKVRIPVVSAFYDGKFGLAQGSRESEKCCIRRNGNKNSEIQRLSISVDTHLMFVLQLVAGVMIDAHLGVFQHFLATDFQQLPVDHGGSSCWSSLLSNTHLYSYLAQRLVKQLSQPQAFQAGS